MSRIYRMADWDEVYRVLATGGFVIRSGRRAYLRSKHADGDWPGTYLGGLTAPLYHALQDANALVAFTGGYSGAYQGVNREVTA